MCFSEPTLQYLLEVACKQAFKPWELADAVPRLKYELAGLSGSVSSDENRYRTIIYKIVYL
jgi:hypothetical protein